MFKDFSGNASENYRTYIMIYSLVEATCDNLMFSGFQRDIHAHTCISRSLTTFIDSFRYGLFTNLDIQRFPQDQGAGRFPDPVDGRRREQQRSHQVPERRVRRLRSVVGRQWGRWCRRRSGSAATTRPGHSQNTVRLGERHFDDEAERQAAQEKIAMTVVHAAAAATATTYLQ